MKHEAQLVGTLELQALGCAGLGCPFYEALCHELILEVKEDGPATRVLEPFAAEPFEAAYVLRFLGGVHRLVLSGDATELARHYPSVGGDGDARAARAVLRELLDDPPTQVLQALTRAPQTNEVGRSIALASGALVIASRLGMALRLREIGSSAGLNLRIDAYWYEQHGRGWGQPDSPVRFVDMWQGQSPPFQPGAQILDRRGCDPHPIDVADPDGALTLLSYIWPEPATRFERAKAALQLAAEDPPVIDTARAEDWLPRHLDDRRPGSALVVYHSVLWQYLDEATRTSLRDLLDRAGATATAQTPLAWLRLEPHPATYYPAELRLTLWDGNSEPQDELLATTSFHGGPITLTHPVAT